jgi:hypothetical protein
MNMTRRPEAGTPTSRPDPSPRTTRPAANPRAPKRGPGPQTFWSRLEHWQILLGAVISAAISAIAILLAAHITAHSSSSGSGAGSNGAGQGPITHVKITITSIHGTKVSPPPEVRYVLRGTTHDLWAYHGSPMSQIYVIIFRGHPAARLVSPPAKLLANGDWVVHWLLHHPPADPLFCPVILPMPHGGPPNPTGLACRS